MFEYNSSPGTSAYVNEEQYIINGLQQLQFTPVEIQATLEVKHGFEQYLFEKRQLYMMKGREYPFKESELRKYIRCYFSSNPKAAERIVYAYDLVFQKKTVSSTNELQKHLKKMEGSTYKIDISDLPISKISRIEKQAIAFGINEPPFDVWNYDKCKQLLKVIEHTPGHITVQTPIKPVIKYRGSFELPGKVKVARGLTGPNNSECVVTFSKDHCVLCNNYVIVASTRNPETNSRNNLHLGGYMLIAYEGTKIYVYAMDIGKRDKVNLGGGDRIYDYGINPKEIKQRLNRVAAQVYKLLQCKYKEELQPKKKFIPFSDPRKANAIERQQQEDGVV